MFHGRAEGGIVSRNPGFRPRFVGVVDGGSQPLGNYEVGLSSPHTRDDTAPSGEEPPSSCATSTGWGS